MGPASEDNSEPVRPEAEGPVPEASSIVNVLYHELRAIAASYCRPGVSGTLQPTVIVHEAYLKLAGFASRANRGTHPWRNREHFLAAAATAMRQVLIDYARKQRAQKRSPEGPGQRVDVELVVTSDSARSASHASLDAVELDDVLGQLESADPRAARVVELRFFGGLTVDETAGVLGLSRTSVEESWRTARAWLLSRLQPDGERRS